MKTLLPKSEVPRDPMDTATRLADREGWQKQKVPFSSRSEAFIAEKLTEAAPTHDIGSS